MPFTIIRNDITKMSTDAIVNAANNQLLAGGGVCGAIFQAAGRERLQKACQKIGYVETGGAVITKGFQLPANYIIHTAGPRWQGGCAGEEAALYSCYQSSLALAKKYKLKSVAFPLISAGIYGYPKTESIAVAVRAISDFLEENEIDVTLVIFDQEAFDIGAGLYQEIETYIDEHYVREHNIGAQARRQEFEESHALDQTYASISKELPVQPEQTPQIKTTKRMKSCLTEPEKTKVRRQKSVSSTRRVDVEAELETKIHDLDLSFSQSLLQLIDKKGMTDVETYKKANIDRKLFSKIRKDCNYSPKKTTAIALAIALELSVSETNALLEKAGYVLSRSNKFDVIIEYFMRKGNYNIVEINEALFAFDQTLLGA